MRNIEQLIEKLTVEDDEVTVKVIVTYDDDTGTFTAALVDVDRFGVEHVLMDPVFGEHALVGRAGTMSAAIEWLDDLCAQEGN